MQLGTPTAFDELVLERSQDDAFPCSPQKDKLVFKTDLQFSDYGESPPLPGTPVIPLLKLGEYEPFDLEEEESTSFLNPSPIKPKLQLESFPALPSKNGCEKDDAFSSRKTLNSSTLCTEARQEDSEDEGVFFAPLLNTGIKVWVMDEKHSASFLSKNQKISKTGDTSQRGSTIFEILKAKKQARPRLGTN